MRQPKRRKIELNYTKQMVKRGRGKIIWQVIEEQPKAKNVVAEYFFDEDAERVVKLQNKEKVWQYSGGIPRMLYITL